MSEATVEKLREIVAKALPEFAGARYTVLTAGWDCVAMDVDDHWIFKFPRHAFAEERLRTEVGLLKTLNPLLTLPVPAPVLEIGPPIFSRHIKLKGDHLVTAQYEVLSEAERQCLAEDLALFYAELHGIDVRTMKAAGAKPIKPWLPPDEILRRSWPVLSDDLRSYAEKTIADWRDLSRDPCGEIYGFFDGHGWNMAFDHAANRLSGVYDFADSGFGDLHQDFIYSNWIAPDLTSRIITRYEGLTSRDLDRSRIHLLSGVLRLSELAEYADDSSHAPSMVEIVRSWACC